MNRFALLLVGLLCVGCGRQPAGTGQPSSTAPGSVTPVKEMELLEAYEGNEAAADARFLDKTIVVKALIYKVQKTPQGAYYAGGYYFGNRTSGPPNVAYVWSKASLSEIQSLQISEEKTAPLTIIGKCKGKQSAPGAEPPFQVTLEDCRLAK